MPEIIFIAQKHKIGALQWCRLYVVVACESLLRSKRINFSSLKNVYTIDSYTDVNVCDKSTV